MIGRKSQCKQLDKILKKKKSSFLAITGRRRVGKTFLIDEYFKNEICFRLTGIQNAEIEEQINNFSTKISEYSKKPIIPHPTNWQDVFLLLKEYLKSLDKKSKKVIFLDELPWMVTKKSNFIQLLAHLWNDYLSKEKHFVLVICGSSTSWIYKNIVNDKGGFHNRLTDIITLKPFTLEDTKSFFTSLKINLNHQEIVNVYMAFGGIPYYLEQINKGENSLVAIERLCFTKGGILRDEYNNLYKALFRNAENHEAIVYELAKTGKGLQREEILIKTKVKSGGSFNRAINDLLLTGFVEEYIPFGRKKKGSYYKLVDEYSIFYHKFIKPNNKLTKGIWTQIAMSQKYKIWQGFAFELLSYKHVDKIKDALGISGVYTEISTLNIKATKEQKGFQIDLILDRKDQVINLIELKYYSGPFTIDKKYADVLVKRKQQFIEHSKTRKQIFINMLTNYGLEENMHSTSIVDNDLTLDCLF